MYSGTLISTLERTSYTGAVSDERSSGFLLSKLHHCGKSKHPKQMRKIESSREEGEVWCEDQSPPGVGSVGGHSFILHVSAAGLQLWDHSLFNYKHQRIALVLVNVSPTREFLCSGKLWGETEP